MDNNLIRIRKFSIVMLVLLLSIMLVACSATEGEQKTPPERNETPTAEEPIPAPDFLLKNAVDEERSLENYAGKTLVISFWTTWCPACKYELAEMQKLHELTIEKEMNIVVLGVNVLADPREKSKEGVLAEIEARGYTFENIFDEDGGMSIDYYVRAFPSTYIVNPEGELYTYWVGALDLESTLKILKEME